MKQYWIYPKTITGDAATDGRYLRREYINDEFWREVEKGNHILFVAPRRVGKTSVMKDLEATCPDGYACIYQDIEGVKTRNEFYRRLFELIVQCVERSPIKKAKEVVKGWFKKYGISEISKSGLKFTSTEVDYEKELRNIIPELANTDVHTVIFLDEFAEVINRLSKEGEQGQKDAVDILHTLREIRSDNDFRNFTLVYAGSIGLEVIIKRIDRPKLINDLHPIHIGSLSDVEAGELIHQLTDEATIEFQDEAIAYLCRKLKHLLPYYIQLMIEQVDKIARTKQTPVVTSEMIDEAFDGVLKTNKNFDDWLVRLKEYHAAQFPFINGILMHAAHKDRITLQELYNMALDEQYNRRDDYMDYMEELMNDGYLVEEEKNVYRFISPFLQQYWLKKYPVYNGSI